MERGWDGRTAHMLIARVRLLSAYAEARVLVLEAPGGYGKSTFAEQLTFGDAARIHVHLGQGDSDSDRFASRLRDACRRAGLVVAAEAGEAELTANQRIAETAAAIVRAAGPAAALVVEDAHHLDAEAQDALARLCEQVAPTVRVIVTARTFNTAIPGEARVGSDELAFTANETAALLESSASTADDDLGRAITSDSGGWPAAIGLAVAMTARGLDVDNVPLRLDTLIDELLAEAGNLDPRAMQLLGFLPILSADVGRAIGLPNLVGDALAAGLPMRRTGEWWRLSDPVREHLHLGGAPPVEDVIDAAEAMFLAGEIAAALDVVMSIGCRAEACRLIAAAPYALLDRLDVDELAALLDSIPDTTIRLHPRCLAQVARAAESRVRIELRARLLDRLERIVDKLDDEVLARELEAERVCDLARDSLVDLADARGRAMLGTTGTDELISRARCLRALGGSVAWRGDARSLTDASHLLAEAAGAARILGNDVWVADALCTLGYSVHFARGEFDHAVAKLSEGIDLLGRRSRRRAVQLTFLADVLALLGRDDDATAALGEARMIGRAHVDERILGYAAWGQAKVVARSRDAPTTLRWLREAERHPGDWLDHPTGTQFLAEAAEVAALVGEHDLACAYLDRARAQAEAQGWPEIPAVAIGVVAARIGDPELAESVLGQQRMDNYLNVSNTWRITMMRAHARARCGDDVGAQALTASVREMLDALGHPALAMLHEPEIWATLTRVHAGSAVVSVRVLGGFAVRVGDQPVFIPVGRPSQVVKLIAVAGRALPIDELADTLWPDSPTDVGRRRLRNVLARVRAAAPVLDRAEGVIALAPGTEVDCQRFERLAQIALAETGTARAGALQAAVDAYTGELLPADRFDEWTAVPRERLQRRVARLLDLLAAECGERGDIDAAVAAAELKLAIDPFDDELAAATSTLLRTAGRSADAAKWAACADRIRSALGLPAIA